MRSSSTAQSSLLLTSFPREKFWSRDRAHPFFLEPLLPCLQRHPITLCSSQEIILSCRVETALWCPGLTVPHVVIGSACPQHPIPASVPHPLSPLSVLWPAPIQPWAHLPPSGPTLLLSAPALCAPSSGALELAWTSQPRSPLGQGPWQGNLCPSLAHQLCYTSP